MKIWTWRSRVAALTVMTLAAGAPGAQAETLPADPPLAVERSQAMQPGAEAAVVLDTAKPSRAALLKVSRACRTTTSFDPVVRPFRAICRNEAAAVTAERRIPKCGTLGRCRARLGRYTDILDAQVTASRRLNAALPTSVADADCRRALRVPQASLTAVLKLSASAKAMSRALKRGGAGAAFFRALDRFYAVDRTPLLNHQGRLDQFRSSCT